MFISEYIKNDYIINYKFIDLTFEKATKLTKKVVKKFGARGHIQNLYKIKDSICISKDIKPLYERYDKSRIDDEIANLKNK